MPLPPAVIPAVAQAGGNLMQSGLNWFLQEKTNKKSRQWSEKMYERQRGDSLMDWALQNHYNSPEQQMKRLKMAGLNPNLVYGDGATHSASPVRSSSVEGWNPKAPQVDLSGFGSAAMSFYDVQLKQAQTDNVKAQTKVAFEDAALRAAQAVATTLGSEKTKVETEQGKFNLQQAQSLQSTVLESAQESLRKLKTETGVMLDRNEREAAMNASNLREAAQRILNLRMQNAKTEDERRLIEQQIQGVIRDTRLKDLDIELKQNGIQPGDAIYWRVLGRILGGLNQGIKNLIE